MKERIIGAIILVVFVVLVVPIFLDGPPADGEVVSERVLLPGQEGQETKTVILNRERSEPIPAASNSDEETSSQKVTLATAPEERPKLPPTAVQTTEQQPARIEQKSPPAQRQEPSTSEASATGLWAVQLGSFSNKDNAEKLAADLRKQGYAAFLSQLQTSSGQLHRVRIGPQKDRESAEAMAARLLKVKHQGQVVPHP